MVRRMKIHPLIDESKPLADLCARLAKHDFVAVDTEFMRESTYWPELCLIQVGNSEEAAAIDPMADGIDIAPLLDLLTDNEDILKVFHAGVQDVEIVYNLTGRTPHPIFDTQIAAMALGMGEQIGYQSLVQTTLNQTVDKGARFTDWSRRPLDKRQLDYAIGDVTHLAELFPKLLERLRDTGRGVWINDEMERLADPANYENVPEQSWKRVKIQSRKPDVLGRLKALGAWRELEAQDKNLPRGRLLRDETLADLAAHPPKGQQALAKSRGVPASWASNDIGRRLTDVLCDAVSLPEDEMPRRNPRKPGSGKQGALVGDLLKLLLKIRSREIGVASRLIARTDELEMLASGEREGLRILEGWRYEEFGHDALDLVEGRLAFAVKNGKLKMTHARENGDG